MRVSEKGVLKMHRKCNARVTAMFIARKFHIELI